MNDLTEQWKKGELPCGWYYIKIADIVFIDFFEGKVWKNKKDEYIDEVLAPAPSYEEWQAKLEENAQLKELLKECKPYINHSAASRMIKNSAGHKKDMKLLTKIDEALK